MERVEQSHSLEEIARRMYITTDEYKPLEIITIQSEYITLNEGRITYHRPLNSDQMETLYDHLYRELR